MTGQNTRKHTGTKGATVKTSPAAIERLDRDLKCVELRKAGATWQAIADTLGYAGTGNAYRAFMAVMNAYPRETVDTCRDILNARYETMVRSLWPKVVQGDVWAIDRVTRICEQQAKLNGCNRAEKVELSVGASALDAALREWEAELRMRAQGQPVPQE